MPDPERPLRPANREEIAEALAYALAYRRGKRHRHAERATFQIAAEVLVDLFELSGFVVIQKPPAAAHSSSEALRKK